MGEIKTFKREQVFFEDVEVGTPIPPITKKYNLMKMAAFASVHGDWCPGHYDYACMAAVGLEAPVAYGMQITAYGSQLFTDWISPNGALKKFASQTRAFTYPYDTLTFSGKVTKKRVEDGVNYVECEFVALKQDGTTVAAKGRATVVLPSRGK
jgi:acyl dehydratase